MKEYYFAQNSDKEIIRERKERRERYMQKEKRKRNHSLALKENKKTSSIIIVNQVKMIYEFSCLASTTSQREGRCVSIEAANINEPRLKANTSRKYYKRKLLKLLSPLNLWYFFRFPSPSPSFWFILFIFFFLFFEVYIPWKFLQTSRHWSLKLYEWETVELYSFTPFRTPVTMTWEVEMKLHNIFIQNISYWIGIWGRYLLNFSFHSHLFFS